jgi:hypothetical protein
LTKAFSIRHSAFGPRNSLVLYQPASFPARLRFYLPASDTIVNLSVSGEQIRQVDFLSHSQASLHSNNPALAKTPLGRGTLSFVTTYGRSKASPPGNAASKKGKAEYA